MKTLRELQSLQGRTAVITGGAGRIGEALAEALAELGATICVFDIAEAAAYERARQIKQRFGVQTEAFVADVATEDSVQTAVSNVLEQFGGIHILINSAA